VHNNLSNLFLDAWSAEVHLSWIQHERLLHNLIPSINFTVTEPYLKIFRKRIPPVGGFDISAIPAIFILDIVGQATAALGAGFPTEKEMLQRKLKLVKKKNQESTRRSSLNKRSLSKFQWSLFKKRVPWTSRIMLHFVSRTYAISLIAESWACYHFVLVITSRFRWENNKLNIDLEPWKIRKAFCSEFLNFDIYYRQQRIHRHRIIFDRLEVQNLSLETFADLWVSGALTTRSN
jgi:uncharacterized protein YggT (Ycf19 family)